ncbi:MAG: hypothetical protein KatS3mg105_0276 [Gemmatales bacterium]|nr:MAG: hypothetical protein KatS3mg105_0276 [Gemmatales bacterium]
MIYRSFVFVCCLYLCHPSVVFSGDDELKTKVARLVELLKDPAKRIGAETELIKLGPDILPLLPDADGRLTPEQRKSLASIRRDLNQALVVRDLKPRRVTIEKKGISLNEVLAAIQKQTQLRVDNRSETNPKLSLALKDVPFWQAVDSLAKEADVNVSLYESDGVIALRPGPWRALPVSYDRLFRVVVKRLTSVRDLESGAHLCSIELELAWEPRFYPLFIENNFEELVVRDDQGVRLDAPKGAKRRDAITGQLTTQVWVHLPAPHRKVERLKLLKGTVAVVGSSRMLEFVFDKLEPGKPSTQTQNGIRVTLRKLTAADATWLADFRLEYPTEGPDFESFESWLIHSKAFVQNKGGERFPAGGREIDNQTGQKADIKYIFVEEDGLKLTSPADWKIVYLTPGRIARVPVKFEFTDLPLP